MAYVAVMTASGKRIGQKITHDQAVDILDVLEGRKEPADDKQAAFCEKVHKVYFSWRTADPIWISANLKEIIPFVMAEWRVDGTGRPTRPDNDKAWEFAKRYQLWSNQRPASLALWYINNYDANKSRKILKQRGYE